MQRSELEHLIRAVAAITNEYEIVVVGSQSILGAVPEAPEVLLKSMEADMYPLARPELHDIIDGSIGKMSPFQEAFGYYAQGVAPTTAILPAGWESRLVRIQNANTDMKVGLCLEPHDLAASKLAAGRDKDWVFVQEMLAHGIVAAETLQQRIASLPIPPAHQDRLRGWVESQAEKIQTSPRPLRRQT